METKRVSKKKPPIEGKLLLFTKGEEQAIERAKKEAMEFMERFAPEPPKEQKPKRELYGFQWIKNLKLLVPKI